MARRRYGWAVPFVPRIVVGVDFSGAKLAGKTAWLAWCGVAGGGVPLKLLRLKRLGEVAGDDERSAALAWLVREVLDSRAALWGFDFPFGLPIELMGDVVPGQFDAVRAWDGGAYAFGLHCLDKARREHGRGHMRRLTDVEEKAPFDAYHYRIIYQTFHGMRDVLAPLAAARRTAVLPLQYAKLGRAARVVVEACPSSTLKRLGLPHQNYKQPGGRLVDDLRRKTRRAIFAGLRPWVDVSPHLRRKAMRDPGGDALDAILAAVGAWRGWTLLDHAQVRRHPRYRREGLIFC